MIDGEACLSRKLCLLLALSAIGCASAPAEDALAPVAVELPSAREVADTGAPDRAPRGKGGFLSGGLLSRTAFGAAKIESARVGAEAVKMAAELHLAGAGDDSCPTLSELVAGKKLDPARTDDPWENPYRVVCEDGDVHAVSSGSDGIEGSADDIRDDATPSDLKRIGEL